MKPTEAEPDSADRDIVLAVLLGSIVLIAAAGVVVFVIDLIALIRTLNDGSGFR